VSFGVLFGRPIASLPVVVLVLVLVAGTRRSIALPLRGLGAAQCVCPLFTEQGGDSQIVSAWPGGALCLSRAPGALATWLTFNMFRDELRGRVGWALLTQRKSRRIWLGSMRQGLTDLKPGRCARRASTQKRQLTARCFRQRAENMSNPWVLETHRAGDGRYGLWCTPWRAKRGRVVPGRRRCERVAAVAQSRSRGGNMQSASDMPSSPIWSAPWWKLRSTIRHRIGVPLPALVP